MYSQQLSDYELQRLRNIEENRKVLLSLGLIQPSGVQQKQTSFLRKSIKKPRKRKREPSEVKKVLQANDHLEKKSCRRRSLRVLGIAPDNTEELPEIADEDDKSYAPSRSISCRENTFGAIPGIPVGMFWEMRMECSHDGVHRPPVAGIHGNAEEGCYSLALSGGYEDDIDMGDRFTYTGEGGRDLKGTRSNPKNLRTAAQSKNQTLSRGNLALSLNVENRRPVRVIRGYKLKSPYAPEYGYRYDGLYSVEKFWEAVGLSGYLVYKFALKRCPDQEPPAWEMNNNEEGEQENKEPEKEE